MQRRLLSVRDICCSGSVHIDKISVSMMSTVDGSDFNTQTITATVTGIQTAITSLSSTLGNCIRQEFHGYEQRPAQN